MSYISTHKSRIVETDDSLQGSMRILSWDGDGTLDPRGLRNGNAEYRVECVLPGSVFFKQILLPINPSLGGRNSSVKLSASDFSSTQLKNLFYVHLVFQHNFMMVQSMMSGQSMYTCVRVPKTRFTKYSITCRDGKDYPSTIDIAIPLCTLLVCLNLYSQNQEISLYYDSDERQIELSGRYTDYSEYWNTPEVDQLMICKLKTIFMTPLQMPFNGADFKFIGVDYFSISPKILYPCLHDIASDSSSSKLVLEVVPVDESYSNCVLALGRGKATLALEWDFSFDNTVFEEFNVSNKHQHNYSAKCWLGVANGIKLARRIRIAIKNDGILLIQVSMNDQASDVINFYYYMHPLLETV
ncbi:hypothetical protein BgAZ_110520 [Babesia gibsoni]|uniref:Uncharacterized protein n=1 Tax=Babesia gibsoni TaxID=33632 RepID=A0AAD8PGZ0_BABGI|nr:hypothetical protein BgAZ_110520 [Babesia gibsoni]